MSQVRHDTMITELKKTRGDFAETVRAIKEHADSAHRRLDQITIKIQEVELYIRDHYIEDPTFQAAMGRLEEEMRDLGLKIDKMFDAELERLRRKD
jgi:predicted metallo-beta-lactamase superfamily hydrolase